MVIIHYTYVVTSKILTHIPKQFHNHMSSNGFNILYYYSNFDWHRQKSAQMYSFWLKRNSPKLPQPTELLSLVSLINLAQVDWVPFYHWLYPRRPASPQVHIPIHCYWLCLMSKILTPAGEVVPWILNTGGTCRLYWRRSDKILPNYGWWQLGNL